MAKGGTLFLDEIGEMDIKLQAKLLRVLQEKSFRRVGGTSDLQTDVRIVAATNVNLGSKVAKGAFRDDLYHRLSRVVIELPALRDRKEDILNMAKVFAEKAFRARNKVFGGFANECEQTLQNYSWPGNVRELLNVVERVALVSVGQQTISSASLGLPAGAAKVFEFKPKLSVVQGGVGGAEESVVNSQGAKADLTQGSYMDLKKTWVDSFEREYLVNILTKYEGNVSMAARDAKLDRSNFLRLLRRHEIKAEAFRAKPTMKQAA
jgi:transcriptional regulator with GAF, ATPase, and Fis domain